MTPETRPAFEGRVAVITGGASGIGKAAARRLAAACATVAVLDLDGEQAAAVATEVAGGALALTVDVADAAAVNGAIGSVEERLGRIDALVCSAGIGGDSLRTVDVTDDEWRRVFAVNCDGVFACNRAVLPGMMER